MGISSDLALITNSKEWIAQRLIKDVQAECATTVGKRDASELYSNLQDVPREM